MGRREDNKAEKQRRLEEAGIAAFLAEGHARASVEKIAAAADVARGTFYLYFKDKDALFIELLDRFFVPLETAVSEFRDQLEKCPDADSMLPLYAEFGLRLGGIFFEHTNELKLWFQESRSPGPGGDAVRARERRLENLTDAVLENSVARGILRPHDRHVATLAIHGAIERATYSFLMGDDKIDPTALAMELTTLVRSGLLPR